MTNDPLIERIVNDLLISISEVNVAVDPDELLGDERILEQLIEKDFVIIRYEDPVRFRFEYESKFRDHETRQTRHRLLIIYPKEDSTITRIPFDVLSEAKVFKLNLFELFPTLAYHVVKQLPQEYLSDLYRIAPRRSYALGRKESVDFILKHLFGVDWQSITSRKSLLKFLIEFHLNFSHLPEEFGGRLAAHIHNTCPSLSDLSLAAYLTEKDNFLSELQLGWEKYIQFIENSKTIKPKWVFDIANFEEYDIRSLMTELFTGGGLQHVPSDLVINETKAWYHVGLVEQEKIIEGKVEGLIEQIDEHFDNKKLLKHQDWFHIADLWSTLKYFMVTHEKPTCDVYINIKKKIDEYFDSWIDENFDTLSTLPPNPPKIVHQIPDYLARRLTEDPTKKIALVVIDGLAYWQWKIVEKNLRNENMELSFSNGAVFAWIPTVTSISRQSIFSGKRPIFLQDCTTTAKEPGLWETFWVNQGLKISQIQYFRKAEEKDIFGELFPNNTVLGLVINTVDEMVHGMVLGDKGMANQIDQWCSSGIFNKILIKLLALGYQVFITADHGNVETSETISISDGILASTKGERVRIYTDEALIPQVKNTRVWKSSGLPENIIPVIALDDYSFKRSTGEVVVHGGASIQEVIVPFIEIGYANE